MKSRFVLVTLFGVLVPMLAAQAAAGDLDTAFDTDGLVVTDFSGNGDNGRAVAIQAGDGKIIVAGFESTTNNFSLARYNTDGSLDTSFDTDGKQTTDFGSNEQAYAVGLQGDGKIVVGGFTNASGDFDFAAARYTTSGSLDTTFDTDGKVTTDLDSNSGDFAYAGIVQTDDKTVLAGHTGSADFALVRYNTDGSLDTGFDSDGIVITDFGGSDQCKAVVQDGDGKIVAAGFSGTNVALARYNTDGSLDTTFDTDGKVSADISGSSDQAQAVAIQNDGKIVIAGLGGNDFIVARFNSNGSLDTSFDTDGKVTTDFNASSTDYGYSMYLQPDQKIVVGGHTNASGNSDMGLARYNTNGSLDTSFSTDGKANIDLGSSGNDQCYGVAMQSDGKTVAAGLANGVDYGVARLDAGTVPVEMSGFAIE